MALRVGANEIDNLYYGASEVDKVFHGANLVWERESGTVVSVEWQKFVGQSTLQANFFYDPQYVYQSFCFFVGGTSWNSIGSELDWTWGGAEFIQSMDELRLQSQADYFGGGRTRIYTLPFGGGQQAAGVYQMQVVTGGSQQTKFLVNVGMRDMRNSSRLRGGEDKTESALENTPITLSCVEPPVTDRFYFALGVLADNRIGTNIPTTEIATDLGIPLIQHFEEQDTGVEAVCSIWGSLGNNADPVPEIRWVASPLVTSGGVAAVGMTLRKPPTNNAGGELVVMDACNRAEGQVVLGTFPMIGPGYDTGTDTGVRIYSSGMGVNSSSSYRDVYFGFQGELYITKGVFFFSGTAIYNSGSSTNFEFIMWNDGTNDVRVRRLPGNFGAQFAELVINGSGQGITQITSDTNMRIEFDPDGIDGSSDTIRLTSDTGTVRIAYQHVPAIDPYVSRCGVSVRNAIGGNFNQISNYELYDASPAVARPDFADNFRRGSNDPLAGTLPSIGGTAWTGDSQLQVSTSDNGRVRGNLPNQFTNYSCVNESLANPVTTLHATLERQNSTQDRIMTVGIRGNSARSNYIGVDWVWDGTLRLIRNLSTTAGDFDVLDSDTTGPVLTGTLELTITDDGNTITVTSNFFDTLTFSTTDYNTNTGVVLQFFANAGATGSDSNFLFLNVEAYD